VNKLNDVEILSIQLKAINEYIDKLALYECEEIELCLAYQELVNDLRQRAGKSPLKYQNLRK
jgi:hypothetical protein